MPVVQSTVRRPSGAGVANAVIRIRLVTASRTVPGYTPDGEIVGAASIVADAAGEWSATLLGNDDITPSGTYYEVTEAWPDTGDRAVSVIVVPVAGGPYRLADLLVTDPAPPGTVVGATTSYVDAGDAATLAAAEAYTDAAVVVGGGGSAVDATTSTKGMVRLAGDLAGTADAPTVPGLAGKQAADADLTAIAALSPADNDLIQRKSGGWTNRTPAQVKADLALSKADVGLGNADNTSDAAKTFAGSQITSGTVAYVRLPVGTAASTVAAGDDARLSDTRAPTAHHTTHESGGSDPVTLAQSQVTGLTGALGAKADLVGGVLPTAQLPALAIVQYLGPAADQTAMLALSGQLGDWTTRTDNGAVYVITGPDPTQLANWTALTYPTAPVTSVAGRTGVVTLAKADVGLGNVDNTADSAKTLAGSQITSGTVAIGRLPTGATGSTVPLGNDSRFSDARTPTAHAASHGTGQADAVSLDAGQVATGTLAIGRIPTGTTGTTVPLGNDTRFSDTRTPTDNSVTSAKIVDGTIVDGDISASAAIALSKLATDPLARANHTGTQVMATVSDAGDAATKNVGTSAGTVAAGDDSRITGAAQKSSNLSDLANAGTARTNLGLGSAATQASTAFDASGAATAAQAASQPLDPDLTTIAGLTATTDNVIQSVGSSWASRTMAQLKSALGLVKADVGLSLVDNTADSAKSFTGSQITSGTVAIGRIPTGSTGTTVPFGNDARFADARTPTAHAASHATAGSDPVSAASIGALAASSNLSDVGSAATSRQNIGAQSRLTTTSKTTTYTAVAGDFVLADTTGGAFTVTLPAASTVGQIVAIKLAAQTGTNAVTVVPAGTDKINAAGTTASVQLLDEVFTFISDGAGHWWVGPGSKSLSTLDARYRAASPVADVQKFTPSSGNWTNPSPTVAKPVLVTGFTAGGGGGSGRRGAAGTLRTGGGGGASGVPFAQWLSSADLPTSVAWIAGAGGTGGAAVTADDTNGNAGGVGGNTIFGAAVSTYWAGQGNGGVGGGGAGNAAGAGTAGASNAGAPAGGASSATGAVGVAGGTLLISNGLLFGGASGGGSGGGLSTSDVSVAGGGGGAIFGGPAAAVAGAAGTGTGGSNGAAGTAVNTAAQGITTVRGGTGGAGGGSEGTTGGTGGSGGNGGYPGGGGGGGAASRNGKNSGAGGSGGDGYLMVVTFL